MTQRADVWMPFYVADYLKDTQHLSTIEHGAYMLLLMSAWTSGGVLPADERRLRRIAGMEASEWAESSEVLLAFFQADEGGYRHKRVDAELGKATANREQKRAAGLASAARRQGNARSTPVGTIAQTDVEQPLNERSTGDGADVSTAEQRRGNPSPSPAPSPLPTTASPARSLDDHRAACQAVVKAGGMLSIPPDHSLLREWMALPDMQLERDVLPVVRAVAAEVQAGGGKTPFKFKLFDQAIREKAANDAAEIDRLRKITARYTNGAAS